MVNQYDTFQAITESLLGHVCRANIGDLFGLAEIVQCILRSTCSCVIPSWLAHGPSVQGFYTKLQWFAQDMCGSKSPAMHWVGARFSMSGTKSDCLKQCGQW